MEQHDNNMATHEVYAQMFVMCTIYYSANVNATFELFPCSPHKWESSTFAVACAISSIEGAMASEVVYIVFYMSPIDKDRMD